MIEVWIKADLDTDLKYEVSNKGRFRRFHKCKKKEFNLLKITKNKTNNNTVNVSTNKKGKYIKSANMNLASIVMRSFYPKTYFKWRQINHVDGDKSNCNLDNLEWKQGFKGLIDYNYVVNLKDDDVDYFGLMVKKYILSNNMIYLQKAIKNHEGLIYLICKDYNAVRLFREFLSESIFKFKRDVDCGRLKPSKDTYKYLRGNVKSFIIDYFRKNPINLQYEWSEKKIYHNLKNTEIEYTENISEEINNMFTQLSL